MPNATTLYGTSGATSYGYSIGTVSANMTTQAYSDSPDLPEMVVESIDDTGRIVRMVLKPESSISPPEVAKLLMLLSAIMLQGASRFSVYGYVKKQNLERHFSYS